MNEDRRRLLAEEAAGYGEFSGLLDSIPADRWQDPSVTPDGWSPVTVTAHVAAWLDECGRVLEDMAAGTFDASSDPAEAPGYVDVANAAHAQRAASMTREAALAALGSARSRAIEALEALPGLTPEAWSWFEESGPMHYSKHVHDLTAWRDGRRSDPQVGPILQAETDAWVDFAATLEQISVDRHGGRDADGWSVVDVVHHAARWMERSRAELLGEPLPGDDTDAINEGFLRESRTTTYGSARLRLEEARTGLRRTFATIVEPTDEQKDTFVESTTEHYAEHLPMLRRLQGSP